jgi:hypothetical protein
VCTNWVDGQPRSARNHGLAELRLDRPRVLEASLVNGLVQLYLALLYYLSMSPRAQI